MYRQPLLGFATASLALSIGCGAVSQLINGGPRVTSVTPSNAPVGTWVDVRGNGFSGLQMVQFGNVSAQVDALTDTDTYIHCLVPSFPGGGSTVDITVTVVDSSGNTETSSTSGKDKFTYD